MSSTIYNLNGNDKTLILAARPNTTVDGAKLVQPFLATNWTDLRFTVAYSLTRVANPNDPTVLNELVGAGEDPNQFYIGFKSVDFLFPLAGAQFFGLSSQLATADAGSADVVAGPDFYRINHHTDTHKLILATKSGIQSNNSTSLDGPRIQNTLVGGTYTGYATLLMLRMTRGDPTSMVCNLGAVLDGTNVDGGVPFITDTSVDNLRAITAAATFTNILTNFVFDAVPNSLFFYWPFTISRLRIHDYVVEKYG